MCTGKKKTHLNHFVMMLKWRRPDTGLELTNHKSMI